MHNMTQYAKNKKSKICSWCTSYICQNVFLESWQTKISHPKIKSALEISLPQNKVVLKYNISTYTVIPEGL